MELEQMDNALKASWQTVAQNMNMVRLLLITRQPSQATHALLSRSEAMMKELMQVKGLTTDTYALGYLRPGNDMTVCRVEVKPEAMPEVLMLTFLTSISSLYLRNLFPVCDQTVRMRLSTCTTSRGTVVGQRAMTSWT